MAAPITDHGSREKYNTMDIYRELGVQIYKQRESARPEKTATFLNPKMRVNRLVNEMQYYPDQFVYSLCTLCKSKN